MSSDNTKENVPHYPFFKKKMEISIICDILFDTKNLLIKTQLK